MTLGVHKANAAHAQAMADLFREMDAFYGESADESIEDKVSQINATLFSDPPIAYALVALDGHEIVGFAGYSFLWPAVLTSKSLYLKELYVSRSRRSEGIGSMLMRRLFAVATEYGCSRVEWTTDDSNRDARQFYKRLGMSEHTSKILYRAEGAEIADFGLALGGQA